MFNCQQNRKYAIFLLAVTMKKIWLSILQCQVSLALSGYLKVFRNTEGLHVCSIDLKYHGQPDKQTKHGNDNLQRAFLHQI